MCRKTVGLICIPAPVNGDSRRRSRRERGISRRGTREAACHGWAAGYPCKFSLSRLMEHSCCVLQNGWIRLWETCGAMSMRKVLCNPGERQREGQFRTTAGLRGWMDEIRVSRLLDSRSAAPQRKGPSRRSPSGRGVCRGRASQSSPAHRVTAAPRGFVAEGVTAMPAVLPSMGGASGR